jgi:hypothetical protein
MSAPYFETSPIFFFDDREQNFGVHFGVRL